MIYDIDVNMPESVRLFFYAILAGSDDIYNECIIKTHGHGRGIYLNISFVPSGHNDNIRVTIYNEGMGGAEFVLNNGDAVTDGSYHSETILVPPECTVRFETVTGLMAYFAVNMVLSGSDFK